MFCEYGVSEFSAINYCKKYAQSDFTEKEIEITVKVLISVEVLRLSTLKITLRLMQLNLI